MPSCVRYVCGQYVAADLCYHGDLKTRISFIKVMTSILKQGAEFNSLADTALADGFNTMIELVVTEAREDVPVMMALVNSVPPENLVRDLYYVQNHINGGIFILDGVV